ncbi:MAG: prepilin-type N-terminal cleavage/methylation domain-containing protein [Phycisphaeraceae bacterium]|nr:prepilin-type N-terminal cleavage/methylation domain-containing protein [Phycisphaeraceae bacterium]
MIRRSIQPHAQPRRAFTLTELLVVIIIIVLVATIAIPSFSSMIASSESALANTRLVNALRTARDAAIRSSGDADAAVVFFFEPGGRMMLVPFVKVGVLEDEDPVAPGNPARSLRRDVFVVSSLFEPVALPRDWMVRGYAPVGTIRPTGAWYEDGPGGATSRRYGGRMAQGLGDWVFPETGFYDPNPATINAGPAGRTRQTFMVRFEAGTGLLSNGGGAEAIIVAPRQTIIGRSNAPQSNFRIDTTPDIRRYVQRVLASPLRDDNPASTPIAEQPGFAATIVRRELLGDQSADTILARSVGQLALYDEAKLAGALARFEVRTDRESGCLYQMPGSTVTSPQFVPSSVTSQQLGVYMNDWIEGDTNFDGTMADRVNPDGQGRVDEPQAKVFVIDRFTGDIKRVEIEL